LKEVHDHLLPIVRSERDRPDPDPIVVLALANAVNVVWTQAEAAVGSEKDEAWQRARDFFRQRDLRNDLWVTRNRLIRCEGAVCP
jgi:hypothetical protein